MGSSTEEWGEPPSPGIILCQTPTHKVPHTEPINNNMKKGNVRIMHVGDTILAAAAEDGTNENWCLLGNQLTCNAFINRKYLSDFRDDPDGKYLRVHCNLGVKQTNKIGDLPGYSDSIWYKPKEIANILLFGLVQKITLWYTTANMVTSFSSTDHRGQHLIWPRLVCFTMTRYTS